MALSSKNVSQILVDTLHAYGVEYVFGIPGDAINSLTNAIRKHEHMKFIQVRHEESGAFAAAAIAKLTGKLSVCLGTAGPGAIHLLNGLYDAKLDRAPVLAITGQVETQYTGKDYYQEIDTYSLFEDVSCFNKIVVNPDQMPYLAIHACQTALARKGVAHINIPVDIASKKAGGGEMRHVFKNTQELAPPEAYLSEAAQLLQKHEKIALLVGVGARGARRELDQLSRLLNAPIVKTVRAKDVIPDDHPHVTGGLGLLGTTPSVEAIQECDLLMMVGTDFPYFEFYPEKEIPAIQIDIDPYQIGKRYPVACGLVGHVRPTLEKLIPLLTQKKENEYLSKLQDSVKKYFESEAKEEESSKEPLHPQALAKAIGKHASDDAIFVCDTGAVTLWGARNLHIRQQQQFTLSSDLASMAYGLPASIGIQLTHPGRQVIAMVGDGGFAMLMADFITAVKYKLPVKIIVFNNSKLGIIQMEQEVAGYPEHETALQNPDFAAFAEICGGKGFRAESLDEVNNVLQLAYQHSGPCVVDVAVNPEERTMPPEIKVKQAWGYGMAKMKEFVGAGQKKGGISALH